MDSILADQLEWLMTGNMVGIRLKRQIVLLAGCLSDDWLPEHIERPVGNLCRQITLQESFDALLQTLNGFVRDSKNQNAPAVDLTGLLAQVEAARLALNDCETVNEAQLIAWVLGRAREKKLLSKRGGRR